MNTGIRNSKQSSITSQDRWNVRLPMRTLAASWGNRLVRPIGPVRVLSGCLSACVQVVQGVPSQTAPATRPVSQPLKTVRNSWQRWSSTGPRQRSRAIAASPRRFTASDSRAEPANSSSTTRRVCCPQRACRMRRFKCRLQSPLSAGPRFAAAFRGGPGTAPPAAPLSGGLLAASGPAAPLTRVLGPARAAPPRAPGCTNSSCGSRARGGR